MMYANKILQKNSRPVWSGFLFTGLQKSFEILQERCSYLRLNSALHFLTAICCGFYAVTK